jgi:hypothetical protein
MLGYARKQMEDNSRAIATTYHINVTSSEQIKRYQILNHIYAYEVKSTLHAYFYGPYIMLLFHQISDGCKIVKYYIETCNLPSSVVDMMARKRIK